MSQHADGGLMATKPYASGGADIDKMSGYCKPCPYDPNVRVGEGAGPLTAGYRAFLDLHESDLTGNNRLAPPLAGLRRRRDRDALVERERLRWSAAP